MRHIASEPPSCDGFTDAAGLARIARRQLLKAAVFGSLDDRTLAGGAEHAEAGTPLSSKPLHVVIGTILDVSPQVLTLQTAGGEERFTLAASTIAWRGTEVPTVTLRQGDYAIVRCNYTNVTTADKIWAQIGRVTGTITARDGRTLLVDDGTGGERKMLVIADHAISKIQVRFPRLLPGYLIDVIGLTHRGYLEGLIPATAQPPYRAGQPPRPPLVGGHVPGSISGTATWHEPCDEPADLMGVAYPALDPDIGCQAPDPGTGCERQASASTASPGTGDTGAHARDTGAHARDTGAHARPAGPHAADPHLAGSGCVRLPYLSLGSTLRVRNDCAQRDLLLPVTGCGATARLFCDRCIACGTSPRGRVADLTVPAFAALGGDLEAGCFNATITVGG